MQGRACPLRAIVSIGSRLPYEIHVPYQKQNQSAGRDLHRDRFGRQMTDDPSYVAFATYRPVSTLRSSPSLTIAFMVLPRSLAMPSWRVASALVSLAMHAPPRGVPRVATHHSIQEEAPGCQYGEEERPVVGKGEGHGTYISHQRG